MFDRCPLKERAKISPQSIALISKEGTLSYAHLDHEVDLLATKLQQKGIKEGERVAILMKNSPFYISLLFAIWRLKACACPLNFRIPPQQLDTCIDRLQPHLLITEPFFQKISKKETSPFPLCEIPSVLLFTSGSTGNPKIAFLFLEQLLYSASSYKAVDLEEKDRWLLSLPLFHVGGLGIILRSILAGASISLDENDPNITHLSYVPTQLYRSSPIYKNLKCILLGGAPVHSFPTYLPIYVTYGLTEMGSWVLVKKLPPKKQGRYFLGLPLAHREIKLTEDGEILVKGKTLFQGYWEKGIVDTHPDWFPTKDLAMFDSDEGFAIQGRKDWQFISGGENIQPEEIEQHLLKHPEIQEAVIVGKKDPEFGHRPVAFIKTEDTSLSLASVQSYLSDFLPKYKLPIALFLIDEMPKIGFKIDRKKLFEKVNP